jgi:hypothetical protein
MRRSDKPTKRSALTTVASSDCRKELLSDRPTLATTAEPMGGDVVGSGDAYMSRGRTLAEVIFAVVCVGFLTGFVAFLCIGNCYRARRAAERQRQRRLANKLLTAPGGAVAIHAASAEGQGGGYNYGQTAGLTAGAAAAAAAAMNGGDMSPQSSASSSNANGNNDNNDNDFGSRRFNQSQERTRLISNRNFNDGDAAALQQQQRQRQRQGMYHDSNNAPRRRAAADYSSNHNSALQSNTLLLLSEQDEYDFPPHTANLMSV